MRYLITFSYDGSKYYGYQKQPKKRTIQETIEAALSKIASNKPVSIHASGRTDAGVHAYNQKAHFDLEFEIPIERLKYSLNSLLPKDIYIKKIEVVNQEFHARFNVKKKEYIYKLNMGEYNPIEKDYICQWNKKLNVEEMKKAISYFIGIHNFKSFTKGSGYEDYKRKVIEANILESYDSDIITFVFVGTGFLRYQIRNMVGTLIEIGEGKRNSSDIVRILKEEDRRKAGITAPPCGLYLKDVFYQ